jgi:hypothetical protein
MAAPSPRTLKIGVTGHRWFDDPDDVRAAIAGVASDLAARVDESDGRDGAAIEVWSSLAEGADRVVADELMRVGATLVVVLPLPADEYRRDFVAPGSADEFDRLLARASTVHLATTDEASREAAYEAAGLQVLEAADMLVAVWDGAPARGRGGTAELVEAAQARDVDVVVVPVRRGSVG